MACIHTDKKSLHYKRKVRKDFEDKCFTCFSYGVYARHRENQGLIKPPHDTVREPIPGIHDQEQFKEGYEALGAYAEQISYPPGLWPDPNSNPCVPLRPVDPDKEFFDIFPKLESGQFGESHHVLMCRFLLQFDNILDQSDLVWSHCRGLSFAIEPRYAFKTTADENKTVTGHQAGKKQNLPRQGKDARGATEEVREDKIERKQRLLCEIEDLLSWYRRPGQRASKEHGDTTGKKNVTSVISAAFRSASYGAPLEALEVKWPTYMGRSTHLFQYIRASLRLVTWYPHTSFPERWSKYKDLISPSHTAKYWLNRYFRLTEQFGSVELNDKKYIGDTPHKYKAMPKCDEIKRLAVVHIRRTLETGSSVGRTMEIKEDPILKHVLDSISQANKLCDQIHHTDPRPITEDDEILPTSFSHVVVRLFHCSWTKPSPLRSPNQRTLSPFL